MRLGTVFLVAVCALLAAPAGAFAVPPTNDDFADRQVVGPGFPGGQPIDVSGDNFEADNEHGELIPGLSPAGQSVWFEWEAETSGFVTIGACENDFPSIVAIFTGTELSDLTLVAGDPVDEGPGCPYSHRQFTFDAVAGTKYVIAVDGDSFQAPGAPPPVTEGLIKLRIEETPTPPNDEFENATPIAGGITTEPGGDRFYFASAKGFNWNATIEHGEPEGTTSGASVWYSWTAPEEATYSFGTPCCGGNLLREVYLGDAVDELTPLLIGPGSNQVHLAAGQTLRIRVAGPLDAITEEPELAYFDFFVSAKLTPVPQGSSGNGGGNPDPPDTTPPRTTISKTVLKRMPPIFVFKFGSSEPGSTFRCSLDGERFKPCGSSKRFGRPLPGRHKLRVVAVDKAGNVDFTPAVGRFRFPRARSGTQALKR